MSIRQAMLALLEQGPMYGYQLRAEFEQRTGETWPLNIGQVYTTLSRLERDGLVEMVPESGDSEDRSHVSYRATEAGRGEVAHHPRGTSLRGSLARPSGITSRPLGYAAEVGR